jgi:hypothetical protein
MEIKLTVETIYQSMILSKFSIFWKDNNLSKICNLGQRNNQYFLSYKYDGFYSW